MTATLIGATGLIGSHLLEELLKDPFFSIVRVLIRRPHPVEHSKLEKKIVDFEDSDSLLVALSNSDVVFCAIGTTNKKVNGDKDAYRKIDLEIPLRLVRFCKMTGCSKFLVVSSTGANKNSFNFYAKLKGEMEEEIRKENLRTIHVMRPSMLLGDRKEKRIGESIGKKIMTTFSFLVPEKYRAIEARDVAKAMIKLSKDQKEGYFIHENQEILKLVH